MEKEKQSVGNSVKAMRKDFNDKCYDYIVTQRIKHTDAIDRLLSDKTGNLIPTLYYIIFSKENSFGRTIKFDFFDDDDRFNVAIDGEIVIYGNCQYFSSVDDGNKTTDFDGEVVIDGERQKFDFEINGHDFLEDLAVSSIACNYYENIKTILLVSSHPESLFPLFDDDGKYKNFGEVLKKAILSHYGIIDDSKSISFKYLNTRDRKKNPSKACMASNKFIFLEDIIMSLYGDNKKSQDIIGVIDKTVSYVGELLHCNASDLEKQNPTKFYSILVNEILLLGGSIDLSDEEKEIISNYLLKSKDSRKILKLFYTVLYTKSLLQDKIYDFYDLSFITVSAFKVVEVIFADLLNNKYPETTIVGKDKEIIKLGTDKLTLGKMYQIFNCDDEDIKAFLEKKPLYLGPIQVKFSKWLKDSRNGYLHKHIIEIENIKQMNDSINDSIELMCLLILLFA